MNTLTLDMRQLGTADPERGLFVGCRCDIRADAAGYYNMIKSQKATGPVIIKKQQQHWLLLLY